MKIYFWEVSNHSTQEGLAMRGHQKIGPAPMGSYHGSNGETLLYTSTLTFLQGLVRSLLYGILVLIQGAVQTARRIIIRLLQVLGTSLVLGQIPLQPGNVCLSLSEISLSIHVPLAQSLQLLPYTSQLS